MIRAVVGGGTCLTDCAETDEMLCVSIKQLSTLHFSLGRAAVPYDGAVHKEGNRDVPNEAPAGMGRRSFSRAA